jgi:uncharacterized protein
MPRTALETWHEKQRRVEEFDLAGEAAMFAPDGVMEFPFAPEGMPRRLVGREQIAHALGAAAEQAKAAGIRWVGHRATFHQSTDPEVIVVELMADGESPNGRYEIPYLQILRIRDGEILLFRDYWTFASVGPLLGGAVASALTAAAEGSA